MKVSRWRRERLGEGDRTREVLAVFVMVLMFGAYRVFGGFGLLDVETNVSADGDPGADLLAITVNATSADVGEAVGAAAGKAVEKLEKVEAVAPATKAEPAAEAKAAPAAKEEAKPSAEAGPPATGAKGTRRRVRRRRA